MRDRYTLINRALTASDVGRSVRLMRRGVVIIVGRIASYETIRNGYGEMESTVRIRTNLYWVEQSEGYWEQKEPSGLCLLAQQEKALTDNNNNG